MCAVFGRLGREANVDDVDDDVDDGDDGRPIFRQCSTKHCVTTSNTPGGSRTARCKKVLDSTSNLSSCRWRKIDKDRRSWCAAQALSPQKTACRLLNKSADFYRNPFSASDPEVAD